MNELIHPNAIWRRTKQPKHKSQTHVEIIHIVYVRPKIRTHTHTQWKLQLNNKLQMTKWAIISQSHRKALVIRPQNTAKKSNIQPFIIRIRPRCSFGKGQNITKKTHRQTYIHKPRLQQKIEWRFVYICCSKFMCLIQQLVDEFLNIWDGGIAVN